MEPGLREEVRQRAGGRCEYCRLPEAFALVPFHVDHIVSQFHNGPTVTGNLALAWPACNRRKGTNLAGIDPDTGQLTPMFNPREQIWAEHFAVVEARIVGRIAVGRTTVWVCDMNTDKRMDIRRQLLATGLF